MHGVPTVQRSASVRVRPVTGDDIALYAECVANVEWLAAYGPVPDDAEGRGSAYELGVRPDRTVCRFVFEGPDSRAIGFFHLTALSDRAIRGRKPYELRGGLLPGLVGQRWSRQIIPAAVSHAFDTLDAACLLSAVLKSNPRSVRALEQHGFRPAHTLDFLRYGLVPARLDRHSVLVLHRD